VHRILTTCCRDEPRKLLAVLTAPEHPLAQHPDSAAALAELGTLFDYLEVCVLVILEGIRRGGGRGGGELNRHVCGGGGGLVAVRKQQHCRRTAVTPTCASFLQALNALGTLALTTSAQLAVALLSSAY
jgi:hypothetical protein